jgi:hypothetical protein
MRDVLNAMDISKIDFRVSSLWSYEYASDLTNKLKDGANVGFDDV